MESQIGTLFPRNCLFKHLGDEKENYNCIVEIVNVAVCEGLREVFRKEWDKHHGVWDDSSSSGSKLCNLERKRSHAKSYLSLFKSGKRSEWDCSALFDAILYSNAIKNTLSPHVANEVHELRKLRNSLIHERSTEHGLSDKDFEKNYKKVKNCFSALKLKTTDVERIRTSSKRRRVTRLWEMRCILLLVFMIGFSSSCVFYYWFMAHIDTPSFRVLPARPVHLIANRSRTVSIILEELQNLSIRNRRSLTHFYLSGNPGCGKSQLARLVGMQYGSMSSFVMTLNGRSLLDILESYMDFAQRVGCNKNTIEDIRNSNQTKTARKIEYLQIEITRMLKFLKYNYTWLLIVDNVANLNEIAAVLPRLEEEDWQGGQVLITTQDMPSVPPNSSLILHISVSEGMDPTESSEFLLKFSGFAENHDLVRDVAKKLDYQPLALASAAFYVKQIRESKTSSHFDWKDYLKKLDEGKRNLTEMKLTRVNHAYSLTMSTAVFLAVEKIAESDLVLKHAFTFLSYVSHEAQPLEVVVDYVLRVCKNMDKEDVGHNILQCSLILSSDDHKVVSILLHRVVHDSIIIYIKQSTEQNVKSRVPLYVLQSLLEHKWPLSGIALIPHMKALCARTKNLSSDIFVPASLKMRGKMQTQLFQLYGTLVGRGEFLVLRNILILAVKMSTNRSGNNKLKLKNSSHIYFPKRGMIYHDLGVVETKLGNIKKGRRYLKQALKILLKQHGSSHKDVSICYRTLGSLSCSKPEECNETEKFAKQALELDDSPETMVISYTTLGTKYYYESNLLEAEKYFRLAIMAFDKIKAEDIISWERYSLLYSNLAGVYVRQGRYDESKNIFNIVIEVYKQKLGRNHLGLGQSLFSLSHAHFELEEFKEAENCLRRALEIFSQQLEPSHETIVNANRNLADLLERTGRLKEAAVVAKEYGTCRRQENPK